MRFSLRSLGKLWAGIVIAVLVPILVFRILGTVIGLLWTRWRTRWTFHRSLMRAGLTEEEADTLTDRYNVRITLREIIHQRHRFGH
jgi:hypothetical protein